MRQLEERRQRTDDEGAAPEIEEMTGAAAARARRRQVARRAKRGPSKLFMASDDVRSTEAKGGGRVHSGYA